MAKENENPFEGATISIQPRNADPVEEETPDDNEQEENKDDEQEDDDSQDSENEEGKEGEDEPDEDEDKPIELSEEETDELLASELEDEYGIDSLTTLKERLSEIETLREENKKLKETPNEPVFKNENEKSLYEFALRTGGNPEAVQQYARLYFMDVDKLDPKGALFEKFCMQKPKLSREKAAKLFEKQYATTYASEDEDEEDDTLSIQLEEDAEEAKEFLKTEQQKIKTAKSAETEEKPTATETVIPKAVEKAIKTQVETMEKSFDGFDSIVIPIGDDPKNSFHFTLSKKEVALIKKQATGYLQNPINYNKDGNLNIDLDVDAAKVNLVMTNFHTKVIEKLVTHMNNLKGIAKIKKDSEIKPTRISSVEGKQISSVEDMWGSAKITKV
jgi:hypothetical protein